MPKRHAMSKKTSKKVFRKGAMKTHVKNLNRGVPMRGGIRL